MERFQSFPLLTFPDFRFQVPRTRPEFTNRLPEYSLLLVSLALPLDVSCSLTTPYQCLFGITNFDKYVQIYLPN
jgi:hypothetical protein